MRVTILPISDTMSIVVDNVKYVTKATINEENVITIRYVDGTYSAAGEKSHPGAYEILRQYFWNTEVT
jgi:hypothetical protein